jgi:acetylornithine deacetylase/succinyl-diaminopimelate desuccinylase family protein
MDTMSAADTPEVNQEEAIRFLQEFGRLNTVNPPGHESIAADFLQVYLEPLGFEIVRTAAEPGRDCLVATLRGTMGTPTRIYTGHTDVPPVGSGWTHDPWAAEIEDGRIYGNGIMDMKAGVAAFIQAGMAYARSGRRLRGNLVLQAVADEVSGGIKGSGHLFEQGLLKGDYAVVCEPTGLDVYIAHRGMMWFDLRVHGTVAHSGRPWLGVNAIAKVGKIMQALTEQLGPEFEKRTHPMLPTPSINFGTIQGGAKENLVAAECRLTFDRRMVPGETWDDAEAEIRRVIEGVHENDPEDWTFELTRTLAVPPLEIDPNDPAVLACQKAYNDVTGDISGIGCTSGLEDAHWLVRAGIHTAMFGPYNLKRWEGENRFYSVTGKADENVILDQWFTCIKVYERLIENLLA